MRLMKADGSFTEFDVPPDYADYIGENVVPYSYGKFPYAKLLGRRVSMDLENPKGIYRANTLARINVADKMATPRAQAELEEFRENFRPPGPGDPALSLRPPHRRGLRLRAGHRDPGRPRDHRPQHTRRSGAQSRPRRGLRGGPPGHPDPRLHHRRKRPDRQANMIVGTTHNLGPST
jgi:F420-non-reducing hydrogenase large subunit